MIITTTNNVYIVRICTNWKYQLIYSNTDPGGRGNYCRQCVCVRLFLFSFHWTLAFEENKPCNVLVSLVGSLVDLLRFSMHNQIRN